MGVPAPAARDAFRIREVHVAQALRKDPLPGLPYSFNPYVGCYHGCVFCYSPRLLRVDREAWGTSVVVKRNAATILAKEVRRLPRGVVAISTATDPYQFVERRYRVTRQALQVLHRAAWPISVLTRSPLVLRDVDLLANFAEVDVGMSLPTLDDEARALLEPWAPSVPSRLRCLEALADAGLPTTVAFAPAYPPTGGWTAHGVAERLAGVGVRRMFVRPLDARWGVREAVLRRLEGSDLASDLLRITDRRAMEAYARSLARACRARGIAVRSRELNLGSPQAAAREAREASLGRRATPRAGGLRPPTRG